jgi:TonB-dependent receptor
VGPVNRKGGTVQGFELAALHTFDNLPGIWSGLGIQANYTYATSKDKDFKPINQPLVTEPDSALPGFAKNTYNATAFYDKDALEIRLGYNYTGKYLTNRSGDGVQPRYTAAFGQLDLSASYDVNDSVTAFFAVNNLTDEARVDYLSQRERVEYVESTGIRYQLGVRAKF